MKNALVIGASRGIGRQISLTLAKNGYRVGVASKTTEHSEKLPGTIYSVAEEVRNAGGEAISLKCNVRHEAEIRRTVQACIREFGHLDIVVYNAGAILWKKVVDTPLKRFELMMDVNARGAYITIQEVLPHLLERNAGKFLFISPPIYSRFFKGKTPYSVSKVGMTILMKGLSHELTGTGVSVSSLWPATGIHSWVTEIQGDKFPKGVLRKSTIFADATLQIANEPTTSHYLTALIHKKGFKFLVRLLSIADRSRLNGETLIDEDYLRSLGVTDFTKYRLDPDVEPPRMMPKEFPCLRVAEEEEDGVFSKL